MHRLSRRQMLSTSAGLGMYTLTSGYVSADDQTESSQSKLRPEPNRAGAELITPDTNRAIQRALTYMARKQITSGRGAGCFGTSGYASGVAVCSLAGLGFMSAGSAPDEGRYSKYVDRCIDFIVASTQESGFISPVGHSNDQMYGHGLATLFLAEGYGITENKEVVDKFFEGRA